VTLPGASELFRPTNTPHADSDGDEPAPDLPPANAVGLAAVESAEAKPGGGSGRVRHDEKITVYVSSDELLALERARLELRAEHGLAVDRGRIVREAIAAMLADLAAEGERSQLVRRLT
jgi:hypothetical protein